MTGLNKNYGIKIEILDIPQLIQKNKQRESAAKYVFYILSDIEYIIIEVGLRIWDFYCKIYKDT